MKTYTYKNVLLRIKDITDLIDVDANEQRLRRLINKAAIESISVYNFITKHVEVDVVNGIGELPCDLFRLLRAYPISNNGVNDLNSRSQEQMEPTRLYQQYKYDKSDAFIKPDWIRTGKIGVSYYAVPTTEVLNSKGEPCQEIAIDFEQLDYCANEAARFLMRDEFARGKINGQVYQLFAQEAEERLIAAVNNTRKVSIDQMESALWMSRNAQFFNTK